VTSLFSTASYVGGYLIFHNPVPLGTISFGVLGFVVVLSSMYWFLVPAASRLSWLDRVHIVHCWLWGMAEHLWHLDQTKVQHCYERYYTWFLMAQGNQAYFIGACEVLTSIPVGWFMANYKEDFALLWNVAYGTMCACMSDWIFQRRAETLHGITSAMAAITLNGFMSLVLFWRTNDPEERFNIIISNSCDVFVGWTLFSFSLTASMVRIRSSSTSSRE